MKTIKVDLPRTLDKIEIVPLADWHLGDAHCDIELIQKYVDYISQHDNVYCLLNGDLINNATKASISDVYGDYLPPKQQLYAVEKLLDPIKDKILCITSGNHEFRTYKEDGIDLMEILARNLGIADRYSDGSACLSLKVGTAKNRHGRTDDQVQYLIYVNHGAGGGRRPGAKVNRLEDMNGIVDADIYVHSHTHLPAIFKQAFYRYNFASRSVFPVDKLFVNTSAFLDYGGYGEAYEFKPSTKQTPIIWLSGKERNFGAKL